MTKAQQTQADESQRQIIRLSTALLGVNGDKGFIEETRDVISEFRRALPLFTTKTECEAARKTYVGAADKRWTRRYSYVVIAFSGIGSLAAIVAILKAFGKI